MRVAYGSPSEPRFFDTFERSLPGVGPSICPGDGCRRSIFFGAVIGFIGDYLEGGVVFFVCEALVILTCFVLFGDHDQESVVMASDSDARSSRSGASPVWLCDFWIPAVDEPNGRQPNDDEQMGSPRRVDRRTPRLVIFGERAEDTLRRARLPFNSGLTRRRPSRRSSWSWGQAS